MSEVATERFSVNNDSQAEWCLKKIREAEQEREMWKKHYEDQWKRINEATEATISMFTGYLEEYFEKVPHKASKTQESYSLPHAKLVRKKQQPKFTVDDAVVVPWLEQNLMEEYVKVEKTANWAGLKKMVELTPDGNSVATEDGEIIDGITVIQRPDIFKVEMEESYE